MLDAEDDDDLVPFGFERRQRRLRLKMLGRGGSTRDKLRLRASVGCISLLIYMRQRMTSNRYETDCLRNHACEGADIKIRAM